MDQQDLRTSLVAWPGVQATVEWQDDPAYSVAGIAAPEERPAMDGGAGARRHGWLPATQHQPLPRARARLPKKTQRDRAD